MTPLFGPKTPPAGVAFGPGYGEHQPGRRCSPPDVGRPTPGWQGSPQFGDWPQAPLDPDGQFPPRQGWFGGYRR